MPAIHSCCRWGVHVGLPRQIRRWLPTRLRTQRTPLFCGYSTRIEPELSPFSWTNVATSQTGRKDWPPTQSPAHLLHSIQDVYTISVHALEPSFQQAG